MPLGEALRCAIRRGYRDDSNAPEWPPAPSTIGRRPARDVVLFLGAVGRDLAERPAIVNWYNRPQGSVLPALDRTGPGFMAEYFIEVLKVLPLFLLVIAFRSVPGLSLCVWGEYRDRRTAQSQNPQGSSTRQAKQRRPSVAGATSGPEHKPRHASDVGPMAGRVTITQPRDYNVYPERRRHSDRAPGQSAGQDPPPPTSEAGSSSPTRQRRRPQSTGRRGIAGAEGPWGRPPTPGGPWKSPRGRPGAGRLDRRDPPQGPYTCRSWRSSSGGSGSGQIG